MSSVWKHIWVAALALALPRFAAAEPEVGPAKLLEAFASGRRDDVARAGRDLRARGLAPILVSPHRPSALAAIAAAPAADDAWELLVPLADLARDADRPIAARAARAAVHIASDLNRDRVNWLEIPTPHIKKRMALWDRIALDRTRWADVRVHALEVAETLRKVLPLKDAPSVAFPVDPLLSDPDPEIRRAALELLPAPLPADQRTAVAGVLHGDENEVVAVVAGQVLCGGLAFGDPAEPLLASAGDAGLARIRALIPRRDLPPLARIEAARCLTARGAQRADRAPLRALVSSVPGRLRAEARRLAAWKR